MICVYGILMGIDQVFQLVEKQNWPKLLAQDQLLIEKAAGNAFANYSEGPITFAPTYKYKTGTDQYERREDRKKRFPAWCDRIQWITNDDIKQLFYRYPLSPSIWPWPLPSSPYHHHHHLCIHRWSFIMLIYGSYPYGMRIVEPSSHYRIINLSCRYLSSKVSNIISYDMTRCNASMLKCIDCICVLSENGGERTTHKVVWSSSYTQESWSDSNCNIRVTALMIIW